MKRGIAFIGVVCLTSALSAQLAPAGRTALHAPSPAEGAARTSDEVGRPFIREYRPVEFAGGGQNWGMVQDSRGVLYIGSQRGVLVYDGSTWRIIETPTNDTVRSIAIDDRDRVWVGSVGDLGYLETDATGGETFRSLLDKVPSDAREFGDVWRTFVTPSGIIFQSERAIFRYANGAMSVLKPASRFNRASWLEGRLYVSLPESGLNVLEGDRFVAQPGTQAIGREPFPVVLRYDERRLLVGTRRNGLYLYDGTGLTPFTSEVDADLKATGLYRGLTLADGSFAFTTTGNGVVIIDRQGHLLTHLDAAHGLPFDQAYSLMIDREGALWVTGSRGIARIETPSPVSFFDFSDGYRGVWDLARHEGRLHVTTGSGAYYLHPATPGSQERWTQISGVVNQCWAFEHVADRSGRRPPAFALGCSDGLYEINGTKATPVHANDETFRVSSLLTSKADPTRLWVGLFDGFTSYRWIDGRWVDEGRFEAIHDQVRSLYENPDGSLWLGTSSTGLLRVRFSQKPSASTARPAAEVDRYGTKQGLPNGGVAVGPVGGQPMFSSWGSGPKSGPAIQYFDAATNTFPHVPSLEHFEFDRFRPSAGVYDGKDGKTYLNHGKGAAVVTRQADGTWTADFRPFARFGRQPMGGFYAEADGVFWFPLRDWFVRFDRSKVTPPGSAFGTLIRQVSDTQQKVLYAGNGTPGPLRLPAASNALRFEFAAPSFLDEKATEYQTWLEGLDRDWTPWKLEPARDLTNLSFGTYRLHVRARNIAGQLSSEASYAFTILPPWYRTWWAYLLYVVGLAVGVYGVDRLQRWRLLGRERERAQVAEAKLRVEAAEALARTESEGKRNIELLSDIGREITASLDFDTIFDKLYERVNQLADADVFGVGLYHPERHELEYRLAIERGKRYAPYTRDTSDPNQLPVWCLEHREPVFINDLRAEFGKYLSRPDDQRRSLEDGSMSTEPQSLIYLPLIAKDEVLGIITIQSFEAHAYTEHHLNVLQSLAAYTAIALDNASAYRQLNEQENENRHLFEEAERARALAEEADQAKSAFLSTVSHELRTPLTSVLGFAKIIKKRLDDRLFPLIQSDDKRIRQTMDQVSENLNVVVSEGERLTKLIDDVLDLAKIEAGKLEWHMESVDVADVIEHATSATSSLFEQKSLPLIKDVEAGLPALTADRDRLIQVVINLISNAVKFTSTGSVTCRARRVDGEIVVSVVDTGLGIAPADQPKVFERFKQVGDTLTDKPKGTGLGLPICREIVEHHGGRIWVESELGTGSTFAFAIPVSRDAASSADGPVALAALIRQLRDQVVVSAPRTSSRQPSILVVDDEANIRELLTQEFSDAGYHVETATNGREAIAAVRRSRPDLIVLDVMMPEMNGFDVAAVLKNDPTTLDIPIVIVSIVQDKERGFRIGVDRYLTKPIDTELLFREVGTLIEQKKSRKRVLVVDQDSTTVRTLGDVLQSRGYTVSEARGEDLIEKAKALQPDIIMMNSGASARPEVVQMLRFEKGLENVIVLVYQ